MAVVFHIVLASSLFLLLCTDKHAYKVYVLMQLNMFSFLAVMETLLQCK